MELLEKFGWHLVVLVLAFLGAYVGLHLTGHPDAANGLGGFLLGIAILGFFITLAVG